MRESPPLFKGDPSYPLRWWQRQPAHFFPRWFPEPRPLDAHRDRLLESLEMRSRGLIHEGAVLPQQVSTVGHFDCPGIGLYPRLASAIIRQSLRDIHTFYTWSSKSAYLRNQADEAREWLFADEDDALFSFLNCCASTGQDPAMIRWEISTYEAAMRTKRPRTGIDTALDLRSWRLDKPLTEGAIPPDRIRPDALEFLWQDDENE